MSNIASKLDQKIIDMLTDRANSGSLRDAKALLEIKSTKYLHEVSYGTAVCLQSVLGALGNSIFDCYNLYSFLNEQK